MSVRRNQTSPPVETTPSSALSIASLLSIGEPERLSVQLNSCERSKVNSLGSSFPTLLTLASELEAIEAPKSKAVFDVSKISKAQKTTDTPQTLFMKWRTEGIAVGYYTTTKGIGTTYSVYLPSYVNVESTEESAQFVETLNTIVEWLIQDKWQEMGMDFNLFAPGCRLFQKAIGNTNADSTWNRKEDSNYFNGLLTKRLVQFKATKPHAEPIPQLRFTMKAENDSLSFIINWKAEKNPSLLNTCYTFRTLPVLLNICGFFEITQEKMGNGRLKGNPVFPWEHTFFELNQGHIERLAVRLVVVPMPNKIIYQRDFMILLKRYLESSNTAWLLDLYDNFVMNAKARGLLNTMINASLPKIKEGAEAIAKLTWNRGTLTLAFKGVSKMRQGMEIFTDYTQLKAKVLPELKRLGFKHKQGDDNLYQRDQPTDGPIFVQWFNQAVTNKIEALPSASSPSDDLLEQARLLLLHGAIRQYKEMLEKYVSTLSFDMKEPAFKQMVSYLVQAYKITIKEHTIHETDYKSITRGETVHNSYAPQAYVYNESMRHMDNIYLKLMCVVSDQLLKFEDQLAHYTDKLERDTSAQKKAQLTMHTWIDVFVPGTNGPTILFARWRLFIRTTRQNLTEWTLQPYDFNTPCTMGYGSLRNQYVMYMLHAFAEKPTQRAQLKSPKLLEEALYALHYLLSTSFMEDEKMRPCVGDSEEGTDVEEETDDAAAMITQSVNNLKNLNDTYKQAVDDDPEGRSSARRKAAFEVIELCLYAYNKEVGPTQDDALLENYKQIIDHIMRNETRRDREQKLITKLPTASVLMKLGNSTMTSV